MRRQRVIRTAVEGPGIRAKRRVEKFYEQSVLWAKEMAAKAAIANAAKREFLAIMSHALHTPMNGMLGMATLLLETELNEEQRDYLQVIHTSGESLLRLINLVLDFAAMAKHQLQLVHQPFAIHPLLAETLHPLQSRAQAQGLAWHAWVDPTIPAQLVGDAERLQQIVRNLVDNAIRFTQQGSITIDIVVHHPDHGAEEHRPETQVSTAEVCILYGTVRDTGCGISSEKYQTIFEPSAQADSSTTRSHSGLGLGLALASDLVHLMHGRLWVDSTVREGSTFSFTVRLAVAAATLSADRDGSFAAVRTAPGSHQQTPETLPEVIIDWQGALAYVDQDEALLEEILLVFREDTANQLEKLHLALTHQESANLRLLSHALKGAAANVHAPALQHAAAAMESATTREDMTAIQGAYTNLVTAWEHFCAYLDAPATACRNERSGTAI